MAISRNILGQLYEVNQAIAVRNVNSLGFVCLCTNPPSHCLIKDAMTVTLNAYWCFETFSSYNRVSPSLDNRQPHQISQAIAIRTIL